MNNTNQIQIRLIAEKDIKSFHACLDAVSRERKFLGFVQAPSLEKTQEWLISGMKEGEIRFIALDGSRVVGWCDIEISQNEGFTHAGRLGMGILKEYRGRGLGSRLLEETLSVARSRGLERVGLDGFASNTPAIKLYEKFNFQIEGRKRKARKIDEAYDDIIVMAILFEK
jgi:ribosomal protein S18 acetylase RimI-like enzyme